MPTHIRENVVVQYPVTALHTVSAVKSFDNGFNNVLTLYRYRCEDIRRKPTAGTTRTRIETPADLDYSVLRRIDMICNDTASSRIRRGPQAV